MIIYKITNTKNNKKYIGQTTQNLDARKNEHLKRSKTEYNHPLYNDMRSLGYDNFLFEVVDSAKNKKELDEKETYYIKKYNTKFPNGYNLTEGGNGTVGYNHTVENKKKMKELKRDKYLGKNNPFWGKHHTEEQKAKWSIQRQGRKLTEEWKNNISKTRKRIPIVNLDTGEIFASARDIARHYGKNPDSGISGTIAKVCKKEPKYKTCLGFHFEYYNPLIHDNTVPNIHFVNEGVTTIPQGSRE